MDPTNNDPIRPRSAPSSLALQPTPSTTTPSPTVRQRHESPFPSLARILSRFSLHSSPPRSFRSSSPTIPQQLPQPTPWPKPRADCGHIVERPFTDMATPPTKCQRCHLRDLASRTFHAWKNRKSVYGAKHPQTRAARRAHTLARAARANHLDELAAGCAEEWRARSGEAGGAAAEQREKKVAFSEDVEGKEYGGRHRALFSRRHEEYVPGKYAGDLLDTAGTRVPWAVFYTAEEERGRGLRSVTAMVRERSKEVKVMFYPNAAMLPEQERKRASFP